MQIQSKHCNPEEALVLRDVMPAAAAAAAASTNVSMLRLTPSWLYSKKEEM